MCKVQGEFCKVHPAGTCLILYQVFSILSILDLGIRSTADCAPEFFSGKALISAKFSQPAQPE
jgi:hypothetical protein